jgi:hypothetical protein
MSVAPETLFELQTGLSLQTWLANAIADIIGFLNYFVDAQLALPMTVNVESIFLVFTTDNGLKNLLHFFVKVEVIFHRVRDQHSR